MKQTTARAARGLLATLALLCPTSTLAQNASPTASEPSFGDVRLGIRIGPNDSNFDQKVTFSDGGGGGFLPWESRTGLVAGLAGTTPLDKYFGIQFDFLYISKGAKFELMPGQQDINRINLNYAALHVLLDAGLPTASGIRPFVLLGPAMSFLLTANGQGRDEQGQATEEDIKDEVVDFDFGLLLGIGVSIPVGSGDLVLDARYEDGIVNIIKERESGFVVENQMFALTLGYMF